MVDFVHDRHKKLDLVLCTQAAGTEGDNSTTLETMMDDLGIVLTDDERTIFGSLPTLPQAQVGAVLLALEAKGVMTAHQRALPRLYDELNSSHLTIHGATDQAIAAGLCMVNVASRYLSPDLNKRNRATEPEWSEHKQPRDAGLAVAKVRQLPRRSRLGDVGYDGFAIVVIDMANDGTPVRLIEGDPSPPAQDIYSYASMIDRLSHVYATRFKDL